MGKRIQNRKEKSTGISFIDRLKETQKTKDNLEEGVYCDHPLCLKKLVSYYRSGPRLCEEHQQGVITVSPFFTVNTPEHDLMPDEIRCSRERCTEFLRDEIRERPSQFLFHCENCKKKVCCFCAKQCHRAGHIFTDVQYESNSCGRTEIVEINKYYVVKEYGTDGKCARNTKILYSNNK